MRSLVRFQLAPHVDFPPGFFDRADPSPDSAFYRPLRLVTHIDDCVAQMTSVMHASKR